MFTVPIETVYWCYSEWQPLYDEMASDDVIFVEGLPCLETLKADKRSKIVVCDDLMAEACAGGAAGLNALFTKGSSRWNSSLVFLSHNLYFKGQRTARLNANYVVIFKNPADSLQVSTMARQMFPRKPKILEDAYKDATKQCYGYLLVDYHQETDDKMRLRTDIFDKPCVYVPR
jgi:hypothetical protein